MGVSSEQSSNNMNRFVVACAFVACVSGAPQYLNHGVSTVGHASYAGPAQHVVVSHGATVAHGAPVASAPVVTGQTHQTYAAGPQWLSSTPSTELSEAKLCRPGT